MERRNGEYLGKGIDVEQGISSTNNCQSHVPNEVGGNAQRLHSPNKSTPIRLNRSLSKCVVSGSDECQRADAKPETMTEDLEEVKDRFKIYNHTYMWLQCIVGLAAAYSVGFAIIFVLYRRLPALEKLYSAEGGGSQGHELMLKIPETFEELRAVKQTLQMYKEHYEFDLMLFISFSYVFLQTFMIPGPGVINILLGSIFSLVPAMLYVGIISCVGASMNFLVVKRLLKEPITALMPKRIANFQAELARHRNHIFNYMLFIRVTPILPHWFVSLASPIVGIPFHIFVFATVIGHQPMNFIAIHAGAALSSLRSVHDVYSLRTILFVLTAGSLALIPVLIKKKSATGSKPFSVHMAPRGKRRQETTLTIIESLPVSM
eukprot:jgi/Picsp_1/767/NSC_04256-R1_snare associated golgi protein